MTLEELKTIIESNNIPEQLVVFKLTDNDFIPNQYINFIGKSFEVEIKESYSELVNNNVDIFSTGTNNSLKVLRVDNFDCEDEGIKNAKNTFIICNKINKKSQELFNDYIITVPKLEDWQIKDYAYSVGQGINEQNLDKLIHLCNGNIYRLEQELQRITLFPENQREYYFNSFINDGVFNDLSNYTIFSFSNALVKKDIKSLFEAYKDIKYIDVEPIGLLILMIDSIKKIIDVQLSVNSSPETLNMKPNQYWAVRHSCGFYTKEQLMHIFSFLTELDKKIKLGEMPIDHLVDYIIIKMLGV